MPIRRGASTASPRAGRLGRLSAGVALIVLAASGCTSGSSPSSSPTASASTVTTTPASSASSAAGSPVDDGPTTSASATSCPFLTKGAAADQIGQRLDKVRRLTSHGRTVGCRFYPLGHATPQCDKSCLRAENLPPASQPSIEIVSTRYASATAARTAVSRLAVGPSQQPLRVASGVSGFCYRIRFYAKDAGKDWACSFAAASTAVTVRTATTESLSAVELTRTVAKKF